MGIKTMRFFFRSRQFKIILSVIALVIGISVICGVIGGVIAPQANLIGTLTAPFRSAASKISNGVSDFISAYKNGEKLMLENSELKSRLDKMHESIADYDKKTAENEFYKNYLEIKDANPDFKFTKASLISRDNDDPYMGFVINKGSMSGIKAHDPVITEAGVVGYITEVGASTSKVSRF